MTSLNTKRPHPTTLSFEQKAVSFDKGESDRKHHWITVLNPTNSQLLLQACDNCGVVKSENSVLKPCARPDGQQLISGSLGGELQEAG
jgi:hypothetical protein